MTLHLKKAIAILCLLLGGNLYISAQTITVSGRVTEIENDQEWGLIGVNIAVRGASDGTITDYDGNYTLAVNAQDTLVFSYLGYKEEIIPILGRTEIDLLMQKDAAILDEVVVVGYGTMKKSDVVGSVSSIAGSEIANLKMPSFDQALQGAVAGVQVNSSGGIPGGPIKIQIRGTNSIAGGTTPLVIIDGLPVSSYAGNSGDFNPMAFLNPEDIKSIDVLKDASATAVYGSRGANGVIIITTKTGKKGKPSTDFSITSGVSQAFNLPEFASTEQWWGVVDQARERDGLPAIASDEVVVGVGSIFRFFSDQSENLTRAQVQQIDNNWFDEALRTGTFTEMNLSHSGASERSDFYLSLNYRRDQSVYESSDFERFSARANINSQFTKILKAGLRLSGTVLLNDAPLIGDGFRKAANSNQTWLPRLNSQTGELNDPKADYNIGYLLDDAYQFNKRETYRFVNNGFIDLAISFVDGLHLRSEVGFDVRHFIRNTYTSFFIDPTDASTANQRMNTNYSINTNFYAAYDKTVKRHYFNVAAGVEQNRRKDRISDVTGTGTTQRRDIDEPGTVAVDNFKQDLAGTIQDVLFYGTFGRMAYKYNNRYIFNGSFRRDGSSRFPRDNRFGTFLAGSVGYVISEEDFWFKDSFFNYLKFKASYGEVGNDQIPAGLGQDQYIDWPNYGGIPGQVLNNIGNNGLSWESIVSWEVGFDFGFLNDRINGGVSFYNMDTQDMLFPAPTPASYGAAPSGGFNSQWTNFADMTNRGLELELKSVNIRTRDFSWSTSFNITFNEATVQRIFVIDGVDAAINYLGFEVLSPDIILREGDPLAMYALPEFAGVDSQGNELIYELDNEGNRTGELIALTPSSALNNRRVDPDKTSQPRFWGGITNKFNYKNFDLSVFVMFQGGNYLLDKYERDVSYINQGGGVILRDVADNRWESIFSETDTPAPNWLNAPVISDRFLHRGDFIKLRSIRLGYTFPKKLLEKLRFQSLQVYVTGNNLFTFTSYPGLDPEVVRLTTGTNPEVLADFNLGQGIITSRSILPQVRTYNVGVNLKF